MNCQLPILCICENVSFSRPPIPFVPASHPRKRVIFVFLEKQNNVQLCVSVAEIRINAVNRVERKCQYKPMILVRGSIGLLWKTACEETLNYVIFHTENQHTTSRDCRVRPLDRQTKKKQQVGAQRPAQACLLATLLLSVLKEQTR